MMYNMNMTKNKILSFIIFATVTFSASFIGSISTYAHKEPWYSTLIKSGFNPPDWVFGPVWTTLYIFMSIAIWFNWVKIKNTNTIKVYFIHIFHSLTY